MIGDEGTAVQRDLKLRLAVISAPVTWWMEFTEQWNPASPWHDRRVRLAANLAIDRQALIEAERLGFGRPAGRSFPHPEFALPLEPFPYDPAQARRLLAEAGYPHGFEAGDLNLDTAVLHDGRSGVELSRCRRHPHAHAHYGAGDFLVRLARQEAEGAHRYRLRGVRRAATRLDTYGPARAPTPHGGHPDIDALFQQQALERDRARREALLHQLQRLLQERVMHALLAEPAALHGVGPRVEEPGGRLDPVCLPIGPYEEMRLQKP